MENHPIKSLMDSTMQNLKEMIDVNTIVGEAIETIDGTVIIPISRVCFGFAAGGSEFSNNSEENSSNNSLPFGGGSGAGVNIMPVGFIIVGGIEDGTCPKFIPVDHCNALDKLLDYVPNILDKFSKCCNDMTKENNEQSDEKKPDI